MGKTIGLDCDHCICWIRNGKFHSATFWNLSREDFDKLDYEEKHYPEFTTEDGLVIGEWWTKEDEDMNMFSTSFPPIAKPIKEVTS